MIVAVVLVGLVALEHVYLLLVEMFLWTSPGIRRTLGMTSGFARESIPLAARQGLHNGFLAAGLIWGLTHPNGSFGHQIQVFFLACVLIVAIYGIGTEKKTIFYVQGITAAAAWIAVLFAG